MIRQRSIDNDENAYYNQAAIRSTKTPSCPFIAVDYSDILGLDISAKKLDKKVRQGSIENAENPCYEWTLIR